MGALPFHITRPIPRPPRQLHTTQIHIAGQQYYAEACFLVLGYGLTSRLGQRTEDSPHLLQGQGVQEALVALPTYNEPKY